MARVLLRLALIVAVVAASARSTGARMPQQRDVVVVILDDVGSTDLAAVAHPNIDQLAARGVTFTHAYSMPYCAPARDSFLRGTYDAGDRGEGCGAVPRNAFTGSEATIADLLHARGYATGLFGKWHCGPVVGHPWELAPQQLGFDVWRAGIASNIRDKNCHLGSFYDWVRVDDGVTTLETQWVDDAVYQAWLAWWTSTVGPRFSVVSFQGAHEPYETPPGFPAVETDRERYEQMIAHIDALVGAILRQLGPEDVVVLFGDNGTPGIGVPSGKRRLSVVEPPYDPTRGKATSYQCGVRVPFIVSGGGQPSPGSTSDALVQPSDVMATLAELLGIPWRPIGQSGNGSVSFARSIVDPRGPGARSWAFVHHPLYPDRAVIESRWKLRETGGLVKAGEGRELFDLSKDPLELVNLYGLPKVATEQARLEQILAGLP